MSNHIHADRTDRSLDAYNNQCTSQASKRRKETSGVWDYFAKHTEGTMITNKCFICSKMFSVNSSTTTLTRHAKVHGFLAAQTQMTFCTTGELSNSTVSPDDERNKKFSKKLIKWIFMCGQSFSVVESPEFKNLIHSINSEVSAFSRATVQRRVVSQKASLFVLVKEQLHTCKSTIAVTTDAWPSVVMRGYLCVTVHYTENQWRLRYMCLAFEHFPTPHTGDTFATMMEEIFDRWNIRHKVYVVTTDNANDMVSGMAMLRDQLRTSLSEDSPHLIHVRCLTHVVNLAVKECLLEVHDEVKLIRLAIASIRSSSKRRELLDRVKIEIGEPGASLPSLDCETGWSSTFEMIRGGYKARKVLNAFMYRLPELAQNVVRDDDWERAFKICEFLSLAATVTESSSARHNLTYSLSVMAFKLLLQQCESSSGEFGAALQRVSALMLGKLQRYADVVNSRSAWLAKILDPRLENDILEDEHVLCQALTCSPSNSPADHGAAIEQYTACNVRGSSSVGQASLLNPILKQERGPLGGPYYEITRFISATAVGDRHIHVLEWWKSNRSRFPLVAELARSVLSIQETSVASESTFSEAGHLLHQEGVV